MMNFSILLTSTLLTNQVMIDPTLEYGKGGVFSD